MEVDKDLKAAENMVEKMLEKWTINTTKHTTEDAAEDAANKTAEDTTGDAAGLPETGDEMAENKAGGATENLQETDKTFANTHVELKLDVALEERFLRAHPDRRAEDLASRIQA